MLEEVGRVEIKDDFKSSEDGPGQPSGSADVIPDSTEGEAEKAQEVAVDEAGGVSDEPVDPATIEKRLKDTQEWGHRANEKAKTLETQVHELQQKLEVQEREERERNRPKPLTKEDRKAKLTFALRAIDELDPEDGDYAAQRAEILAEAFDSPTVDEFTVEEKVRQVLKAEKEVETTQQREARVVSEAEGMAKQSGLDMTPGSRDHKLFWDSLGRAPMGEGVTLKDQVDFMVKDAKGVMDSIRQEVVESLKRAEDNQTQNAPLERGGKPLPAKSQSSDLFSISDHLNDIYQRRRL
jgi:hypothetical protein